MAPQGDADRTTRPPRHRHAYRARPRPNRVPAHDVKEVTWWLATYLRRPPPRSGLILVAGVNPRPRRRSTPRPATVPSRPRTSPTPPGAGERKRRCGHGPYRRCWGFLLARASQDIRKRASPSSTRRKPGSNVEQRPALAGAVTTAVATLGPGYDMGGRRSEEILRGDLQAIDVSKELADKVAEAAGLKGEKASPPVRQGQCEVG
ncbi:MAG: hypothetical protein MZV65_37755 [Chromatiales bacterium]|nr:hypothetical protein [Chromatiales bacterium]